MHVQRTIAFQAILFALLGAIFCFWSVQGNDVNFCNTAGCTLYHDVRIAGLSLWIYAIAVFVVFLLLGLTAPLGLCVFASGAALFADTLLLFLMLLTAPCLNCLGVALIFALTYNAFRKARMREKELPKKGSVLIAVWFLFFCINVGNVVRLHAGPWAMAGDMESSAVHLYFSPSCPHCRDAVAFYGGSVSTAFYPVAEKDTDLAAIKIMQEALEKDVPIEEALRLGQNAQPWPFMINFTPDNLLLRFRVLVNKAHVYSAGSLGVPFIEYRGIPRQIERELKKRRQLPDDGAAESQRKNEPQESGQDSASEKAPVSLDFLEETNTQCTSQTPCP